MRTRRLVSFMSVRGPPTAAFGGPHRGWDAFVLSDRTPRQIARTGRMGAAAASSAEFAATIPGVVYFRACEFSAFTNRLGFFEKGNNAFIGKELREIRIYGLDKALRFGLSFKALFFTGTGPALRLHREVVTHW